MKIMTILGARPQFIKAAAVSRALGSQPGMEEILVHTGQHYDANMSEIFFQELGIPKPSLHLGVGSGSHGAQTGRTLELLDQAMRDLAPHWVLVYGDTNSTLAGGLAAAKLNLPIAHVEAGLRSFNRRMPEEINRVVVDHLATLLFAPTEGAVALLAAEGIQGSQVQCVGDVMYDVVRHYGHAGGAVLLDRLGLQAGHYVLSTIHRAENTDDPARLRAILEGLQAVARELPVLLPLHPRTRKTLAGAQGAETQGLILVEPMSYLDMVVLERHAALIATDSGGVQKEAFFQSVPCVTLRDETEWTELVALGWNRVVSPSLGPDAIAQALRGALGTRGRAGQPYGDGHAAERIVQALAAAHGKAA